MPTVRISGRPSSSVVSFGAVAAHQPTWLSPTTFKGSGMVFPPNSVEHLREYGAEGTVSFASRLTPPGDLSPAFLFADAIPCSLLIVQHVIGWRRLSFHKPPPLLTIR